MKDFILSFLLTFLTSCTQLPEITKAIDDIATDDAITVKVDREAFKNDTDVHVNIDVINKDVKQP